jgi:hypothetical protein
VLKQADCFRAGMWELAGGELEWTYTYPAAVSPLPSPLILLLLLCCVVLLRVYYSPLHPPPSLASALTSPTVTFALADLCVCSKHLNPALIHTHTHHLRSQPHGPLTATPKKKRLTFALPLTPLRTPLKIPLLGASISRVTASITTHLSHSAA